MDYKKIKQLNAKQQDEIEKGFDFLENTDVNTGNDKQNHSPWRYFLRYLKPAPVILFLGLFFVFNVDSSGGITIASEMPGAEKYLFATVTILIVFPVLAFLAAMMFPPILECEFKNGSYKNRLKVNSSYAGDLLKIVKTSENLKTMGAMIKTSLDNSGEMSNVLLTVLASIGIFIGGFPVLIGLKLIDGGVLAPLVGLAGIYFLNLLRLELAPQNIKRRAWLLIIEAAQNLKLEEKRILPAENILIQPAQFEFYNFAKKMNSR